jgi:hypothetical protein
MQVSKLISFCALMIGCGIYGGTALAVGEGPGDTRVGGATMRLKDGSRV